MDQESIKKFLEGESTLEEAAVLLDWAFGDNGENELLNWLDQWWHKESERDSKNESLFHKQKLVDENENLEPAATPNVARQPDRKILAERRL